MIVVLLCPALSWGQEENPGARESFKPFHQLGLTIGHETVFSGRNADGEKTTRILPFWGLDYNFQFSKQFAVGLHTDFVMETFEVEKDLESGPETTVERTWPIAPAAMFFFKPSEHWNFGLGAGGEFSKEENYFLNRASVEYSSEIRNGWEVAGSIQYDFRWNAYDTWTIGLGLSKAFGRRK